MLLTKQYQSLVEVANHYADNISEQALAYLAERGISEEVAARYSLGTITDPMNGHDHHEGWLSIPYITAMGMCVGFKFRRLDGGTPKYGSPAGQKAHLYNVPDILILSPRVVVCEGELDTVIVSGVLGIPAVGVPGVSAWKDHFSKMFNGYDTIYIVGDNDVKEDGSNPGAEFSKRVSQEVLNGQIVQLPAGMDINEFYLKNGAESTRALLGGE